MLFRNRNKGGIFQTVTIRLFACIFILWFLFSVLVLGALRVLSVRQAQKEMANQKTNMAFFSVIINNELDRVANILYALSTDESVNSFVHSRDREFDWEAYLLWDEMYTKLRDYLNTSLYLNDIFILIPQKNEMLTALHSLTTMDEQAMEMAEAYKNKATVFFNTKDSLIYLLEGENNILCGVEVSKRDIQDTLKSYGILDGYDFFLTDSQTGMLLSEAEGPEYEIYRQLERLGTVPSELKAMNITWLLERIRMADGYFDIIVYANRDDVYRDVRRVQNLWIPFTVFALLMPFGVGIFLRRMLSNPMRKLIKAMQMVEEEQYGYRLVLNEASEFNYVFAQYNSMAAKVEDLIHEVYEKQLQVEQAKLKQLQAQINPHFLFNSFYIGYRMAKNGDTDRVAKLCLYLGDYFKVLTYISDQTISLRDEIKFTETYLKINEMRFGDKLSWKLQIEGNVGETRVPPLLFQPIIENAIKHGIERINARGEISIKIWIESDKICFSIRDTCKKMTEEKLREIERVIYAEKIPEESFGLWNTEQRLKALSHGKTGLKFELDREMNFTVSGEVSTCTES